MDESSTRRGQPCWYAQKNVGKSAINDGLFLENIVYFLAKKYASKTKYYTKLLDFCHETTLKTIYGQNLDTRLPMEGTLKLYGYELL
jgi:farnesyl diphosphate synthase